MTSPSGLARPRHAPSRDLGDLARAFGLAPARPAGGVVPGVVLHGVSVGSRSVAPGDLFAALPGARAHGADHAAEAVDRGAVAVLTDPTGVDRVAADVPVLVHPDPRGVLGEVSAWVHGHPARDLRLAAITGTNGKTTTTFLLEAALRTTHARTGLLGTVESRVGDLSVPSARTTLEAPELHGLFARMREEGVTACAMEVSSHALELGRVGGVRVDVAGFTNLQREHLDFHGDMAGYYAAKAALFTPEHTRHAVVTVDDEWGVRLAREVTVPCDTVATRPGSPSADWTVTDVRTDAARAGSTFVLHGPDGAEAEVRVPMPGVVNVSNAALAVVVAVRAGVDLADAVRGVGHVGGVPGRMEAVVPRGAGLPLGLVDYAHTPDALELALAAAREVTPGRLVLVFGSDGDRDRGKRPIMGAIAARLADVVVVTDENPRYEDAASIRAQILSGVRSERPDGRDVHEATSRQAALRQAFDIAAEQDTIIVTGKGHEPTQEIDGVHHPYNDAQEMRTIVAERTAEAR